MQRNNKFECFPDVQPSESLSTCIFSWLAQHGNLMSVEKISEYDPSASLSSDRTLVSIALSSAGTFLARRKEGQISF